MLEIRGIYKNFDGIQAVHDFSLEVPEGKITSLIGPNGAGKSTVFNIITGFLEPGAGAATYKNRPLVGSQPWKITRLGISRTFQGIRLFGRLSVLENVMIGRKNQTGETFLDALLFFTKDSSEYKQHLQKTEELLEFVGLIDKRNHLAETLSYGQQKLLSVACCLATEPDLLLLDEPVSGVQPAMIEKISEILHTLVEKQTKTVFLIEHDIDFVLKNSNLVVVMDEGKKIAEGSAALISNNPEILEAYLS